MTASAIAVLQTRSGGAPRHRRVAAASAAGRNRTAPASQRQHGIQHGKFARRVFEVENGPQQRMSSVLVHRARQGHVFCRLHAYRNERHHQQRWQIKKTTRSRKVIRIVVFTVDWAVLEPFAAGATHTVMSPPATVPRNTLASPQSSRNAFMSAGACEVV
jgi:hypothetical protein